MPDYSEFPTTPTRWQETVWPTPTAEEILALQPAPQPRVDRFAVGAGAVFMVLAVLALAGVELTLGVFDGGLLWLVLIGLGVALLVKELRRPRRT